MAIKKTPLNASSVVAKMVAPVVPAAAPAAEDLTTDQPRTVAATAPKKAKAEKKIPVTLYLTPKASDDIRAQTGRTGKAKDRSAFVALAVEIALKINAKNWDRLMVAAEEKGVKPGKIIDDLLSTL